MKTSEEAEKSTEGYDVVVIGAGMAGLAAARALAEAGQRVVLLEAQERVGGRIRTVREGDLVIETGAEFVHGRAAELFDLIAEAGLTTYERTGSMMRRGADGLEAMEDEEDEDDPLERLKSFAGPDCSFAEYVAGMEEGERQEQIGYVEGFNAADAQEISVLALGRQQRAEDAIEGDRSWRISEGYDRLPEFLLERFRAAGGEMVFGERVRAVTWSTGMAETHGGGGNSYSAKKMVIAVPLPLLQQRRLRFVPEVPQMLEAAGQMRMGHVCRFTLVFGRPLWPEKLSFLFTPELVPRVWWTAHPHEAHTLTGWVGGPGALELLALDEDELKRRAVTAVALALEVAEDEVRDALTGFHTHNWDADGDALGAYSYVTVGGAEASAAMARPVGATLFFAGEHTDVTGHWGTVHAAFGSGLRAARQVLESS